MSWFGGVKANSAEFAPDPAMTVAEAIWWAMSLVLSERQSDEADSTGDIGLPGAGVRDPLAPIGGIVTGLRDLKADRLELDDSALSLETRRMLWRLRLAVCTSEKRSRATIRNATSAVEDWLDVCFGLGDDPALRGQKTLQITFGMLGQLERSLPEERMLLAAAMIAEKCTPASVALDEWLARWLLSLNHPSSSVLPGIALRRARLEAANELMGEARAFVLVEAVKQDGYGALEEGQLRNAMDDPDGVSAGQLAVAVAQGLEGDGHKEEARKLLLQAAQRPDTPVSVVRALLADGVEPLDAAGALAARWSLDIDGLDEEEARTLITTRASMESARAMIDAGQAHQALQMLRRLEPTDEVLGLRGFALLQRGGASRARDHFEQAAQLNPDSAEWPAGAGRAAAQAGDWAAAAAHLQLAMRLGHRSPADALTLSRALVAEQDLVEAEQWLVHADEWAADPNAITAAADALALQALSTAEHRLGEGQREEARGLARLAARHGADHQQARATLLLWKIAAETSAEELVAVLGATPDEVGLAVLRDVLAAPDGPSVDQELAEGLQARWPDYAASYVVLALSLMSIGEADGALMAAEAALQRFRPGERASEREMETLYLAQVQVHRNRQDQYGAAASLGQGLQALGTRQGLATALMDVLSSSDPSTIRVWEQVLGQILGASELTAVVKAMKAGEFVDSETDSRDVSQSGVLTAMASALETEPPPRALALSWCNGLADAERLALALEGQKEQERRVVNAPPQTTAGPEAPSWTVRKVDRASDAFES